MSKPKYEVGSVVYCPHLGHSYIVQSVKPYPSPTKGVRYVYTIGTQMPETMLTTAEEEFGDIDDE